jgi:hypothetical protein
MSEAAIICVKDLWDTVHSYRIINAAEARLLLLQESAQNRDDESISEIVAEGTWSDMRADCAAKLREWVMASYLEAYSKANEDIPYDPTGCSYRDPNFSRIAEGWEKTAEDMEKCGMTWEALIVRAANEEGKQDEAW